MAPRLICVRISHAGIELRRRHATEHHGLAVGHGAVAAKKMVGLRATAEAGCAAMASIGRSRSSNLLSGCARAHGARSNGGKARPSGCPRVLLACAFGSRIAITISLRPDRKSGC